MNDLKIELYLDIEGREPRKLAECVTALSGLRAKGTDRTVIRFNQKMKPMGKITAEATFFPKKNKIKRGEAVREKRRVHRGRVRSDTVSYSNH